MVETIQWNIVNPGTGLTETITLTETGPNTGIFENTDVFIRFILPLTTAVNDPGDGMLYIVSGTSPELKTELRGPGQSEPGQCHGLCCRGHACGHRRL